MLAMTASSTAPKSATKQAFSLAALPGNLLCAALRDFASFFSD
jgi:hypothetical protein